MSIINVDLKDATLCIVDRKFVKENSHIIQMIAYELNGDKVYELYYSNFKTNSYYLVIYPNI